MNLRHEKRAFNDNASGANDKPVIEHHRFGNHLRCYLLRTQVGNIFYYDTKQRYVFVDRDKDMRIGIESLFFIKIWNKFILFYLEKGTVILR